MFVVIPAIRGQDERAPLKQWTVAEHLAWNVPPRAPFHTFKNPPKHNAAATRVVRSNDFPQSEEIVSRALKTVRADILLSAISLALPCAALGQTAQQHLYTSALSATCANCHGSEGRAAEGQPMPRLAGMERQYLVEQMRAFRDGQRPATVMHQISKGFTNEHIEAMATYFAQQK